MKRALLGGLVAAMLGAAAHAGGIDDGNAGLAALQQGDNDGAIVLFTRALGSGGLRGDDREFAYANRGVAYLNKGDLASAIADLDKARQMKPDDADTQNALIKALSTALPATILPGQSAKSMFRQVVGALGQAVADGIVEGAAQSAQGQ
jgi:Tfp pilus assembly protein PilF